MSGFGAAGRLLFTAACGKIRAPCVSGRRDAQVATTSTVLPSFQELSPLLCSFRSLSVTSAKEKAKIEEKLGLAPPPTKPLTPYLRWSLENRVKLSKNAPEKSLIDIGRMLGTAWVSLPEEQKKPYVLAYERDFEAYKKKRDDYLASLTTAEKEAIAKAKKTAFHERKAKKERISLKKKIVQFNKPKKPMSAFMIYASKRRQELAKKSESGAGGSAGDLAPKVSPVRPQPSNETPRSEPEVDLVSRFLSFAGALLGSRDLPRTVNSDLLQSSVPKPPVLGSPLDPKDQTKKIAEEWRSMSPEAKAAYETRYKDLLAKYHADLDAWEQRMVSQGHSELVRIKTRSKIDQDGKIRLEKKQRQPKAAAKKDVKTKAAKTVKLQKDS